MIRIVGANFTAPAPDRIWVADFTYVRSWAGFVYVAFILDVIAQMIVGWHAATDKRTDLGLTPLRMGAVGPRPSRAPGAA